MIIIIIPYVFSLYSTLISIISFASGWGHFRISGKISPGWSGEMRGHKMQEEGAQNNRAQSQFHSPAEAKAWRCIQCHNLLQWFLQLDPYCLFWMNFTLREGTNLVQMFEWKLSCLADSLFFMQILQVSCPYLVPPLCCLFPSPMWYFSSRCISCLTGLEHMHCVRTNRSA